MRIAKANTQAELDDTDDYIFYDVDRLVSEVPDRAFEPSPSSISKLEAISSVLAIYDVFEDLSAKERDNLLGSILAILDADLNG